MSVSERLLQSLRFTSSGIHDLADYGPHLNVEFSARRFKGARVVWLNVPWWVSHAGVDPHDCSALADIEDWLVSEYAASTLGPNVEQDDLSAETLVFQADRYGAPSGLNSGGSGRCGTRGIFSAKGCGPTPLVAPDAGRFHRHGRLFLDEGIREAIYSRIANSLLPHGGHPVVAIIDTASRFKQAVEGSGLEGLSCALLIRPTFIRPASLQRSILFGDAGTKSSAQYLDALRVRDATNAYVRQAHKANQTPVQAITSLFLKYAEQVGACWAHRLSHDFLASNLTLGGQIVDYGSFRHLPTWTRTEHFGRELEQLASSFEALSFYLRKCGFQSFSSPEKEALKQALTRRAQAAFVGVVDAVANESRAIGVPFSDEIPDICLNAFLEFQTLDAYMPLEHRTAREKWWFTSLSANQVDLPSDWRATKVLLDVLARLDAAAAAAGYSSSPLRAWLRPKRLWYLETIRARARPLCTSDAVAASDYRAKLAKFIDRLSIARNAQLYLKR